MNNYLLWAQLITTLANSVAAANGADPRALAYLSLLTLGVRAGTLTDADLDTLKRQIEDDIAQGRPVTREQLDEIDARIQATSDAIQQQPNG